MLDLTQGLVIQGQRDQFLEETSDGLLELAVRLRLNGLNHSGHLDLWRVFSGIHSHYYLEYDIYASFPIGANISKMYQISIKCFISIFYKNIFQLT